MSRLLIPEEEEAALSARESAAASHRLTEKATNPKQGAGERKVNLTNVSGPVLCELALGMTEGAYKYGRHNYRVAGVLASTYIAATIRHCLDFWEGQDNDAESGIELSHITKAMASLAVLRDAMIMAENRPHLFVDDRPPPPPAGWLQRYNAQAAKLLDGMVEARGKIELPYTAKPLPKADPEETAKPVRRNYVVRWIFSDEYVTATYPPDEVDWGPFEKALRMGRKEATLIASRWDSDLVSVEFVG